MGISSLEAGLSLNWMSVDILEVDEVVLENVGQNEEGPRHL